MESRHENAMGRWMLELPLLPLPPLLWKTVLGTFRPPGRQTAKEVSRVNSGLDSTRRSRRHHRGSVRAVIITGAGVAARKINKTEYTRSVQYLIPSQSPSAV